MNFLSVCLLLLGLALTQAFVAPRAAGLTAPARASTELMACRRNNKMEKRRRNRGFAMKYRNKSGISRKKVVIEEKRAVVAASEEKFQAQVFSMTTDDDMPAYTGFDFV